MREGEMMHCQMEKMLDNEIRKMKDGIQKPPKDEKQDNMFN
jgi:hypothetical protein